MKMLQLLVLVCFCFALMVSPAMAQSVQEGKYPPPNNPVFSGSGVGMGLGMGLTVIGAGIGLGRIGAAALESMARQPEVAPRVQTAMIIIAAMLEGATLASVVLCFVLGQGATF